MGRDDGSEKKTGKMRGESFAELLDAGVRALPDSPTARPRRPAVAAPKPDPCDVAFEIERQGEGLRGRAPGVSRRELRRFESLADEKVLEVDLHGLTAPEARKAVHRALGRARQQGTRWLHVIHGRGLRSEGDAVLKRSLPGWLAESPHGAAVLAFVCSPRLPGSTGATRVWLRRQGPGEAGSR